MNAQEQNANEHTVTRFGLTTDRVPPSPVRGAIQRRVTKQTYEKHNRAYRALIEQFEGVKSEEDAAKIHAQIVKCAAWFDGVGIKADRGEARARRSERQRRQTIASATDHKENAKAE